MPAGREARRHRERTDTCGHTDSRHFVSTCCRAQSARTGWGARTGLGGRRMGHRTLASAVGWPRVHNRRSAATLCPGTDAVQGNPRHTACCGKEWCGVRVRHLVSGRIFGEGGAPTAPAAAAPNHRCSGTGACSDTGPNGSIRPNRRQASKAAKISPSRSFVNFAPVREFPALVARPAGATESCSCGSRLARSPHEPRRERARVSRHARVG